MAAEGLEEVANPSLLFLSGREAPLAGSAVFPALEGTRPVLVEIQALIVRLQSGATPRRAVVGWDSGRLAMLLAVLESRCGLNFSSAEVYLNIAGGYRLTDPAADLAVAAALVSALADKPLPDKSAWFGEVSLAGEIRPVAHAGLRLREAAKLGFARGFGPAGTDHSARGINYRALPALANLVDQVMASA
jgi:DNA repair protein RadA/Sms